ncbi:MAG: oligosaccharide flippase family protein [Clostridia bacterium]|nr:oligosaccharide flippase family protein [Clostridia bacterium]
MDKKNSSLTKNSIFYMLYNVLNVIFPFITGIYISHILLPETIGLVESARNLAQYFVILSFLGIPTYGLKIISQNRNDKKRLNQSYTELMVINFISTVVFSIIFLIVVLSINKYRINANLFFVVGISIFLNIFNNSWLFEGLEEFKYISIRNLIFKILSFILLIVVVRKSDDYLQYALVTVIGTAGNYLLNIFYAKRYVTFKINREINIKQHLKSIFYLVLVNLAIEIYTLVDITMLDWLGKKENIAYYSYGSKIFKILIQIINTFTIVLVPRIALYYKEKKYDEFNDTITKTLKTIIILAIPLIIGVFFTSDYLLTAIYGSEYIYSAQVLKILSLILTISPIGYLLGSRIMLVTDNEKKMIIPVVCGAITNIICNYFFIQKFQEIGAAIASVISEIVVMIIYIYLGKRYFKLENISNLLIKELVAIILMIVYLYLLKNINIDLLYITILQIIGAVVIYFGTLIITKEEITWNFLNKGLMMLKKRRSNG